MSRLGHDAGQDRKAQTVASSPGQLAMGIAELVKSPASQEVGDPGSKPANILQLAFFRKFLSEMDTPRERATQEAAESPKPPLTD